MELKAQSGENSQLFIENSIVQNTQSFGNQSLMMSQGTGKQSPYSHQLSMNSGNERPRVTVNLMDVSFLEQNLSSILEVSLV